MAALYYNDKKIDDNLTYVKIEGEFEANNQSKTIDITENGETTVTYDDGYTGLESVTINTHIQGGGGGGLDFTQIGYDGTPEVLQTSFDYSKQIYDNWDASVTNRQNAFQADTQLVYFPAVDTSNVTNMSYMFNNCGSLQIVPHLDTSKVYNMSGMFSSCNGLTSLDFSGWDTSMVTGMNSMFRDCTNLISLDLNNFNTSNVTDMTRMFSGCRSLTSLDLSSFDTSNVSSYESFYQLFYDCKSLTSLDLSNWNTSKITNMGGMFDGCNSLTSITFSDNFNTSNVTKMNKMFDSCSGLTSLDLSSFDTSNVTDMNKMFNDCKKLQSVQGILDMQKITGSINAYYFVGYSSNNSIRKLTFLNLGYNSNNTSYDFTYIQNWGVISDEVPDAKQSLIDSLLTNSFDRTAAGYSTCTITLHANSKATLSEDEIAQITSKGYTIA